MLKFVGISLSVLFCSLLLKDKNRSLALLLSLCGGVILLLSAVSELREIVNRVGELTGDAPVSAAYIRLMLKALGITLITQFVSDNCRDNGENALASVTETVSKIAVITMLLPLFETVVEIVRELLK
ncbi:MAG: hypothetical protein IJS03_05875 [Eubacterium sp.]|nr:hypothetical protein [Eubacterium sp.]